MKWPHTLTFLRSLVFGESYGHHCTRLAVLNSGRACSSVIELGSLLPTPKDGIVTPISFRVKKRGLRGFLAEADAQEDGKRHITGEWVINKRLWRRMQSEFALKKTVPQDGRVVLYLHGGKQRVLRLLVRTEG